MARPFSAVLLAAACLAGGAGAAGAAVADPDPPVLTFAWVSDLHLDAGNRETVAGALRFIDAELKPDFVLVTGDACALAAPEDPARPEPESLRRQRFLQAFLAGHLARPAVVIPGDNWPRDFEKVFGPFQSSFDCAGLHFLLLAPDRSSHAGGAEGLSVFDPPTREWIRKDLEASRGRPTLVAIHEPVHPPTFLDARPLRALLDGSPDVVAVLQGHLHADLDYRPGGRAYLVAPSLGRPPGPAFKLVRVGRAAIVLRTYARPPASGRFEAAEREQTVGIPERLRGVLARPAAGFARENPGAVPAHPHADDPSLAARRKELLENLKVLLEPAAPGAKGAAETGEGTADRPGAAEPQRKND